ncbi:MAG: hypothetical protein L0241_14135 [Planctomycetia bacterium]|nr:hypothetical protein [Planctomycetia bacterium]
MADDPILAIWTRLLTPTGQPLPPNLAGYFLRLGFSDTDRSRMGELSEKAQTGSLSADERAELEAYCHASAFLSVLQSKARVALRTALPVSGNGAPAA